MDQLGVKPRACVQIGDAVASALRDCFYDSNLDERLYFGKLSRTYEILFTLRHDTRVVSYFNQMAGDLRLYVGTDILVRALSERFIPETDRVVRTTLRMASDAGATLVLAEPVLDEVVHNLRVSDHEYNNYFRSSDSYVDLEMARNASKILVRSYYYWKLGGGGSGYSWERYIEQFRSYSTLHRATSFTEMRDYWRRIRFAIRDARGSIGCRFGHGSRRPRGQARRIQVTR